MIQPDRTQAPPFQLSSDYSLTQPEVFSFSGGQPLYAFRGLAQQVIKLDVVFRAGKWYEPHSGISYFTAQMLKKGTLRRSSFQIASALDSLGAHLDIVAGFDTVTVSLYVLRKNFSNSLDILLEILRVPAFADDELRLEKEIFVQNLRVNNEKTNVVASKEIRKRIFGSSHPYGNSTEESDMGAIRRDSLADFFSKHFAVQAAYLVGPISDADLGKILSSIEGSKEGAAVVNVAEVRPGSSHKLIKEGSVQASIRLGKPCLTKRNDTKYFDAVMFNHILGGYFGSRLMKNIREEKGLTYGIHSGMNHFFNGSFWVISAEVNQQNAEEAVSEIKNEIRRLQDELVPTDELEVARNYFIGSWQSDNSTLFAVAEKVRNIHEYHLPADYYHQMLTHFQQMTPDQIQRVAQAHFGADDLVEVQVG